MEIIESAQAATDAPASPDASDERVVRARHAVTLVTEWVATKRAAVAEAETQFGKAHAAHLSADAEFQRNGEPAWPALQAAADERAKRLAILDRARGELDQMLETLRRETADATAIERHVRLERLAAEHGQLIVDMLVPAQQIGRLVQRAQRIHTESGGGATSFARFLDALNEELWQATRHDATVPTVVVRTVGN